MSEHEEFENLKRELEAVNKKLNDINKKFQQLHNNNITKNPNQLQVQRSESVNKVSKEIISVPDVKKSMTADNNNNKSSVPKRKSRNESKNIEDIIGKNIMPVLASILVLFGLGNFAYLVWNVISESLKCFTMFLISFILFGFGLFKLRQEESNFSLALSACGTGAVYVSLIASRFYFGYLSETWLFNFMLLWSGLVYYLACLYKDNIFSFISYMGINYAVYLALKSSFMKPYLLLIFAAFTAIVNYLYGTKKIDLFYYKNRADKEKTRCFYFVANLIMFVYFSDACKMFYKIIEVKRGINIIEKSLIFIGLIILFVSNLFNLKESSEILMPNFGSDKEKANGNDKFIYVLFGIGNLLANYFCVDRFSRYILNNNQGFALLVSLVLICFYAFFIINKSILNIILLYYPCRCIFSSGVSLFSENQVTLFAFLILYLVLFYGALWFTGVYFDKLYFKYISFVPIVVCDFYLILNRVFNKYSNSNFLFRRSVEKYTTLNNPYFLIVAVCSLFVLIANIFLGFKDGLNKFYFLVFNWFSLSLSGAVIGLGFAENKYCSLFIALFTTVFLLAFQWFYYDLLKERKEKNKNNSLFVVFSIIHNLTLLFNLVWLFIYKGDFLAYFIILFLSLAQYVCMFRLLDLDNKSESEFDGYWIGVKSTVYFYVVLRSLLRMKVPYVYTMIFILIAVLLIVLGQKIKLKSLRLYGLYMSLVLVFKLLVLDISYGNSIERVFSLICAGLLCFGIVRIYNKITQDQND